ncbi:hypothetical protein [Haladaptatus salinisoli]|uniref:hypothetical protein n=1 Tax=Haladaptatus salinisoli TaxID=2884876 RepID=UPI001D09C43A|nr:hypothetical protein [Haladaptatus salinisoli]
MGALHGAISGTMGGVVFALMFRDVLVGAGGADGAYWGIAYLVATITSPSIAAQFDSLLAILLPIGGDLLFISEAAVTATSFGGQNHPVCDIEV